MSDMPPLPLPRAFPPMRGAPPDPNRRNLGTSGTWSIGEPSPSLNPLALGADIDPKDKVRSAGAAALGHAQVVAIDMRDRARRAHIDENLSVVERHRKADLESGAAAAPWLSTMEKAVGVYQKDIAKLGETLVGPKADAATENDIMRALTKLGGTAPHKRFGEIKKNIDAGSDLLVLVMTRSDPFLIEGLLSETERDVMMDHWRKSRFPEETIRLRRLELDLEAIGKAGRILESYQVSCSNPSITKTAGAIPPMMANQRGAPGPRPVDRGMASMSLAERAAATGRAIQAQQDQRQ